MTTIEMMVGLPCSGKSSYCQSHSGVWISSDEIRRELYGDASVQEKPDKVFRLMWRRLCEAVERDEQTIFYDATNVVAKRRVAFCDQLRAKYGSRVHLVARVFNTPIHSCIDRAQKREERPLPEEVIWKFVKIWQTPYFWEGWDDIVVEHEKDIDPLFIHALSQSFDFDQKNKHHTLPLYQHMRDASQHVEKFLAREDLHPEMKKLVVLASSIHDIGKPLTQTFDDEGFAHYFAHECVSGYLTLGYGLFVSALCSHHMDIFKKTKLLDRMDDTFKTCLKVMYEADVEAH